MDWNVFTAKRLSRGHYWAFFVASIYIGFGIGMISAAVPPNISKFIDVVSQIFLVAFGVAFTVSRFHDQDMSGWYVLIPGLNLIAPLVGTGTTGPNQYGDIPAQLSDKQTKVLKWFAYPAIVLYVFSFAIVIVAIANGQPIQ